MYDPDNSPSDFQIWVLSNYIAWPYPGTRRDQPWYVWPDFQILLKVKRWWFLNDGLESAAGLPNFEDA